MESSKASPTTRLFNTIMVTMLAILLGLFCVRLKLIVPEQGDLKGMGFFVSSIAFPLLVFQTIATASLESIHFSVILACSLGKIIVMVLTWILAFVAFKPHRSIGQRVLTASVFAFFAVASNDFAIGFPVIDALYSDTYGMDVYIAGNAVVGSFVFVPLTMIAFAVGGALQKGSASEGEGKRISACQVVQTILKDLSTNPVIVMSCLGLVFKVALGGTLVTVGGKSQLPPPFHDLVELLTGPFGMLALFLTGTSLNSAQLAVWPCGLVLMKVVVCAYLSYAFGTLLLGKHDAGPEKALGDFTFFYGAIPTSSAPILFASRFDPEAAELMATAVLFGLILAGPIMFVTAYSLNESGNSDQSMAALTRIQFSADAASILAGIFFMSTLALIHRQWNFRCPAKQMLAWYGIVVLCYNIVSITSNPIVSGYVCEDYRKEDQSSPMVLAFGMLQHTASLIKLVLQWMLVCGPAQSVSNPTMPVFLLCVCMGLSLIPAFLATPNTLNEICGNKHDNPLELCLNVAWSYTRLSIALLLAGYGICKRRNKHKELSAETSSESEASDSAPSELDQPNEQAWKCWGHLVPRGIIMAITVLSIVKDMIQVVNAAEVHFKRAENAGSFAAMLLLESVLEHAQGVFLLAALFFDQTFSEMMLKFLPKVCPCLGLYQKRAATMMMTRAWSLAPQPDPSDLCDAHEDDERRQND